MDDAKRETKVIDNQSFRERYQFILSINDNIICQRYFKITGFDHESLESVEFIEAMDDCVKMIKDDLAAKSRIYMWYTNESEPMKLTGFVNDADVTDDFIRKVCAPRVNETIVSENGLMVEKTYINIEEALEELRTVKGEEERPPYVDERPEDGEFVFKFAFLFDDKPYYEAVWDGNVYPRYVRNTVDLTNTDIQYKGKDVSTLPFSIALVRHMTFGRKDLIYHMIKRICDVCSNKIYNSDGTVTNRGIKYSRKYDVGKDANGNKREYSCNCYNRAVVNGWREATKVKTLKYRRWVNNEFSEKELNYFNRYL